MNRPTPLLNGNCCFSDDDVRAIDGKPVEDLGWGDYAIIFNVSGCAVPAEQRVWFLPHAFAFARREPEYASEFIDALIYFIADRSSPLPPEIAARCREEIAATFRAWTSQFRVRHHDLEACRAKGWRLQYDDQVENATLVADTLGELCRFLDFIALAEELFASLVRDGRSDVEAAWYLELSRRLIESRGYYEGTPAMRPASRSKTIMEMVNDVDEVLRADAQVRERLAAAEASPTYWRDLREFFGLS